ncbi:hypothetical protein DM860_008934 [Cuscuta australis]|uniref:Protein PLANT CADMIUM RESISTANCE 8 n=2 Tax=Cuscuta sect. Cleistogrammica TaxID=1824901 RepID=A0A328D7E0_9ASTE|nr:hypothetical protein DM860_008934 [Cuscuta australis]
MGGVEGNPEMIMVQPVAFHAPRRRPPSSTGVQWTTGLFDCHQDLHNACMTAILPCKTFGQIYEILNNGVMPWQVGSLVYLVLMPLLCSQWVTGSRSRTKLRQRFNLVEAPFSDVFSHIFCSCCSLCQEFRELRNNGLDPAKGMNHTKCSIR